MTHTFFTMVFHNKNKYKLIRMTWIENKACGWHFAQQRASEEQTHAKTFNKMIAFCLV